MAVFLFYVLITGTFLTLALTLPNIPDWIWNFGILGNVFLLAISSSLSFLAYQREQHYRQVFFALWIVFAVNSLANPVFAIANSSGSYDLIIGTYVLYPTILVHSVLAWAVTVITVGYVSNSAKRFLHSALAGLAVFAIAAWLYYPYVVHPLQVYEMNDAGQKVANYGNLDASSRILNMYALLMLLAFYVHKYRTDRPIGAFADTLLFLFGFALAIDTAESLFAGSQFAQLIMSQWVIMVVNAAMAVCLVLRLKFKSQTIADYYESQCVSDDPAIDRRIGRFDRLVLRAFFDPEKVGSKVFLGTGSSRMKVRRTPTHVMRRANG